MEFLYTRFINLITSEPSIRTVLPLKAQGIEDQEVRADVSCTHEWERDGRCVCLFVGTGFV